MTQEVPSSQKQYLVLLLVWYFYNIVIQLNSVTFGRKYMYPSLFPCQYRQEGAVLCKHVPVPLRQTLGQISVRKWTQQSFVSPAKVLFIPVTCASERGTKS